MSPVQSPESRFCTYPCSITQSLSGLGREKMIKSGRGPKNFTCFVRNYTYNPTNTKNPRSAPVMAKVSAEDVACEIGLAADKLSKPCDSNIIPSLNDCFREWEIIFGSLLSEIDIDDVNKENTTGVMKRTAALRKWRDRNGCEATYKVLVNALLNRGERHQAENLCHKILEHHSMSDKNGK